MFVRSRLIVCTSEARARRTAERYFRLYGMYGGGTERYIGLCESNMIATNQRERFALITSNIKAAHSVQAFASARGYSVIAD